MLIKMDSQGQANTYEQVPINEDTDIKLEVIVNDKNIRVIEPVKSHTFRKLEYGIDEKPPWSVIIFYSIQQISTSFVGPLTVVLLLRDCLCLKDVESAHIQARLLSTSMFMMGLATFLQCTLGVRLPVIQGSAISFIVPIIALMSTEKWKCPESKFNESLGNITTNPLDDHEEAWVLRLREINGCLMCTAVVQILLGATGAVGLILNFIGPLTMGPTISILGLSLCKPFVNGAQEHWGVTWFTMILMIICTLILGSIKVPFVACEIKKGVHMTYLKIFKLFPMIITMIFAWLLCLILTLTNTLPTDSTERGYMARTDAKLKVIEDTPWIIIPYPGQFGMPTASIAGVLGMFTATIATIFESIGDYYATAKVVQIDPPPKHAINRGVLVEGVACFISGGLGTCHPTTSYSSVIGFIGLTGVGALRIWQVMAIFVMLLGIFGKVGAVLAIIPEPIVTGGAIVGISFVLASGISLLQYADLNSPRNLFIIGFSYMIGTMIPDWLDKNPSAIRTGNDVLDQSLTVFLKTGMCVGGILAMFLDNILPGSLEERGMHAFKNEQNTEEQLNYTGNLDEQQANKGLKSTYNIPFIGNFLKKYSFFRFVPFLPTYTAAPEIRCKYPCKRN